MEYVYAAMLLHKAGKEINEENIKKILDAAGIEADNNRVKALIAALEGVDIDKVIEEATIVPVQAPAAEEKKEVKEEKKEEEKEAAAGLGALFG